MAELKAEPRWVAIEPEAIVTGDFVRATLGPFEHEGFSMPATVRVGTVLNTFDTPLGARMVTFCDLGFYVGTPLLPPYRFERLVTADEVDEVSVAKAARPDWADVMIAEASKMAHDASLEGISGLVRAAGLAVSGFHPASNQYIVLVPNPTFGIGIVASFHLDVDGSFLSGQVDIAQDKSRASTTQLEVWFEQLVDEWIQPKGLPQ